MLCAGVTMGMMMAGSQDFSLKSIHAHINLLGARDDCSIGAALAQRGPSAPTATHPTMCFR